MKYIALLFLCASAYSQVVRQNGSPSNLTAQSVTVNGTSTTCFSADNPTLIVDCNAHAVNVNGAGGFTVSGSTLTVATTGTITAPSQPAARATLSGAQSIPNGNLDVPVYWGANTYNRGGAMHSLTVSSQNFTANGTGLYYISCKLEYASLTATNVGVSIFANGARVTYQFEGITSLVADIQTSTLQNLTSGQVAYCAASQNSAGSVNLNAGTQYTSYMEMVKIW